MARDNYEDGMKIRRKMLGDAWVDRSLANRNDFNAEIQQQITRQAWGEVWTRPGIDPNIRRFMAISTMIALRAWDEFRLHVHSGLTQGDLSKDELKEVIIQATAYCGAPAGNHAMQQAEQAFRQWQNRG
jgi:alkylhydroperoxidase/carboxymuconolactone decarboxylase family protein YurZ